MNMFDEELNKIAGESVFTTLELQKLFRSDEEREAFAAVRKVLVESRSSNEATRKLIESGAEGIKVLVKVAKYALTA